MRVRVHSFASRALVVGLTVSFLTTSCGGDAAGRTLNVPADYATIQAAVDAAKPGDLVLVAPGVYSEAVKVTVDDVTIRGTDRNNVVLEGEHRLPNGIYVGADGVSVENLTVRNYTQNGVVFNGIDAATNGDGPDPDVEYGTTGNSLVGWAARYVTSHNNGLYGIYAFAASDGVVEDSWVSGHPDSGIYIGQCNPCRAVVRRVTAHQNAIGYYGTNASGDVWVVESTFSNNRLGIAPNSQRMEKLAPQLGATIAGNLVIDNDDPAAPAIPDGFFGGGIAIGGGASNVVVRNRVEGHDFVGIVLTTMNDFLPLDNRVEGNVLDDNTVDLAWAPQGATTADGNCFAGNSFTVSQPVDIEDSMSCDGTASVTSADVTPLPSVSRPGRVDHREIASPPAQPSMPSDRVNAPRIAPAFVAPVLEVIKVPAR